MNYKKAIINTEQQIRQYFEKAKIKKAVIGISGGLDSSVVAALCSNVLGKENVLGISMPYGDQDTKDANLLISYLGIESKEINIKEIIDKFNFIELNKVSKGNIMARVRMIILYAFANELKGLVVGTGNKSEIKTGYFTKYGDGGVDIEPLGDLYKTEVFEIARILKIPEKIINKKPSAGLWEGNTDEDDFGISYKELDEILKGKVQKDKIPENIKKLIKNAGHKSKMPPIFKISGKNGK